MLQMCEVSLTQMERAGQRWCPLVSVMYIMTDVQYYDVQLVCVANLDFAPSQPTQCLYPE